MANGGNTWQHRKADSIEERFGLLDNPKSLKYRKTPVWEDPKGKGRGKLTAVGFTCGIGSMLVGARDMGFRVIGNIEWRDYYRFKPSWGSSTFVENFPGAFQARGADDAQGLLVPGTIDFAAGHPECGRYSNLSHSVVAGNGAYKESRESDVSDIPLFLKMVARFKPRFFLMDDLPASFQALPMEEYVRLLPEYDLFPEWISNWGYGNIQKYRNRMFVVGALKTERFAFVPGEMEHTRVLKDDILDLIGITPGEIANHSQVELDYAPGRYVNMNFYGHRPTWRELQGSNQDLMTNLPYFTPDGARKIRPGTRSPDWEGFCPVLSGGFNPLHPLRKLPLTVRERARIQGFSDSFVFHSDEEGPFREVWEPYNSDGQRGIKQTGKAMPLQFCTFVAAQVKAHIEGRRFKASGRRVIKENPLVSQAKRDFCRLSGYSNPEAAQAACWLNEPVEFYKGPQTLRRKKTKS